MGEILAIIAITLAFLLWIYHYVLTASDREK